MAAAAWPGLRFHWSALLTPGGRGQGYPVALLPLGLARARGPDAPLRHGTACGPEHISRSLYTKMISGIHSKGIVSSVSLYRGSLRAAGYSLLQTIAICLADIDYYSAAKAEQ